ncbi:MAG: succinate:quinone oxidoreductase [Ignavibacteriae bacterium HGW-Ignavibacteriae-4]|jgi:succinate dehydrogenase / fumarate reductase cytochrome b subunit|nr:MAG: succinate:quinone oxidoreductase [Ignavibacteriae bacterium HGW-Ignavibacteriae-4]
MLGFLKSNILSKFVVAITGIILVGFIIGHTLGNLLIFAGPEALNTYAIGLRDLGPTLWVVRIVLIIAAILHVITTINLVRQNKKIASGYKVSNYKASTFSARFMGYAGLTILFFVLYHLAHFTLGFVDASTFNMEATLENGRVVHDVYSMVVIGFRNVIVSLFYILAVSFLGLHLKHGIHSMFQSLGIHGKKFTPMIQKVAAIVALIIVISLISIPISIMLGIVGGQV